MMFQNLIESGSHTEELARRSSFFIGTIALYAVLFLVGGVLSIYAYDAHLENQQTELELLSFVPPPMPTNEPPEVHHASNQPRPAKTNLPVSAQTFRQAFLDSASNPHNVPESIGIKAGMIPPTTDGAVLGKFNSGPISGAPVGATEDNGEDQGVRGVAAPRDEIAREEPPKIEPLKPAVKKKVHVSDGVLAGKIINKVIPPYTAIAKAAHAQGAVVIEVLLDETGRVISAHAVSGHPLLRQPAEQAARQTRFTPTLLSGEPVKVSGTITFNFVLN